jgi:hypothetical protein
MPALASGLLHLSPLRLIVDLEKNCAEGKY